MRSGLAHKPPSVGVVENDDLIVGGQPQVAFDARARSSAAAKAIRLFSGKAAPECSPRCAKPAGPGSSGSVAEALVADLDDRIDLDRDAQRQHRHADRAAGMAPGLAEHLLHQLRRAVGDLGLVGEVARRLTNTPSLTTRSTRSSEPSAAFICASSMMPQRRAAAVPASRSTSSPSRP